MHITHHNMQSRYKAKERDLIRLHKPMNLRKRFWFVFK